MPDLALVHLVRKANGPEPFREFLESYRAVDAGAEHDLVLLLKGFGSEREANETAALADGLEAQRLYVDDTGFDVGAYFTAIDRLEHARVCFVNSFTTARAPGWLGHLETALRLPDAGIAGATGSWGSHWSWLRFNLGLSTPYRDAFPSRAWAQAQIMRLTPDTRRVLAPIWARHLVGTVLVLPFFVGRFDQFPAAHVRTNGFVIERELMRSLERTPIRRKYDAFVVESGRRSVSRQIEELGLRPLLAGADGLAYDIPDWARSGVFWQRDQENVLLDDNQTRSYRDGDLDLRTYFAAFAWGTEAEPTLGPVAQPV
ncbi:MAG TPA: hypothetical protein VF327_06870 [Gaiellaceae bacterium]